MQIAWNKKTSGLLAGPEGKDKLALLILEINST